MTIKSSITLFILYSFTTGSVQASPARKKLTKHFELLEAYTVRIQAGRPGSPSNVQKHFIIIWRSTSRPESFFWYAENGGIPCRISKAHKLTKRNDQPRGIEYTNESITNSPVRKGDTLDILPLANSKAPMPSGIGNGKKNNLYYKTTGSKWYSCPVSGFAAKPDILMP